MFCSNCGSEVPNEVKFCSNCGKELGDSCGQNISVPKTTPMNSEKEQIILETKGSLVGGGTGKIVLTNKHIIWSKSAANIAMIGLASLITKGSTSVNLDNIISVDTFVFLGGGGLQILANDGKKYKFGFNKKADRDTAMSYIQKKI